MGVTSEQEDYRTEILPTTGGPLIPAVFGTCAQVWVESPSSWSTWRPHLAHLSRSCPGGKWRCCPSCLPPPPSAASAGKRLGTFSACIILQPNHALSPAFSFSANLQLSRVIVVFKQNLHNSTSLLLWERCRTGWSDKQSPISLPGMWTPAQQLWLLFIMRGRGRGQEREVSVFTGSTFWIPGEHL